MSLALSRSAPLYPGLERDIEALREFAMPLAAEVKVTPLMPVIARIMSLNSKLDDLSPAQIATIEREVNECKRLLEEVSYEYINQIISKPDPSSVFKILANANIFARELKAAVGKRLTGPTGQEITITPKLIECLTHYRFSLGTPPITPKGIKTIEAILFGGTLHDIYSFRDLLGGDTLLFDRFLGATSQMIEQSTHYTTDQEKKDLERRATEFTGSEGLRGLTKTVISGRAPSAIRLIREHLLSQYADDSKPIKVIDEIDKLDDDLIEEMKREKGSIFVVRVSSVPHHVFTDDVLKAKWQGVIGRLILIDDSSNARRSNTTFVYSLHPAISASLAKFHVKDSGTPANTQMNLRLILENFSQGHITELREKTKEKMEKLEAEGANHAIAQDFRRKQEWHFSAQKDYLSLKRFHDFLTFLLKVKTGDESQLDGLNADLSAQVAYLTMEYFFKPLKAHGYKCVSVPQGGGRREIGLVGKYYLGKHKNRVAEFRSQKLAPLRERLEAIKSRQGVSSGSTTSERDALQRSLAERSALDSAIQEDLPDTSRTALKVRHAVGEAARRTAERGDEIIEDTVARLDEILGVNLPGILKTKVTNALKKYGLDQAAKMLERGGFRVAANRLRALLGTAKVVIDRAAVTLQAPLESLTLALQPDDLNFIERMLNDIEQGSFSPSLALSEVGWTFNDVLNEYDFPKKRYLKISLDQKGNMDPDSLEQQLESTKRTLAAFPELFELYCSSILLIINDPHNPTSKVAKNNVKLKILDIASRYKLTILADEAYHKQVAGEIKEHQGDPTLAEFYEQNKSRFPNPITIHSILPTTKWAMGAGRRTGVIVSNERDSQFEEFVRSNIDSTNTVSLYMDHETLITGLAVKKVCKALEPAIILTNPIAVIDQLLSATDIDRCPSVYFALLEARNDLDRLKVRAASPLDYKNYINDFIKELKDLRLDKQTQKDSAKRSAAAVKAMENLSGEYPELKHRCIEPEGPFYFCVQLDETGKDTGMAPFLAAITRARKIDVVPVAKGYTRFAFGGMVDGSDESYELLTLAIQTDLKLLLKYWNLFKEKRANLNAQGDLDPVGNALKSVFPGGEIDFVATVEEKAELIKRLSEAAIGSKGHLVQRFSSTDSHYLSSIEPDSPATIVTIRDVRCKDINEFISSPTFRDLFNHYLLTVKHSIPELEQLDDSQIIARYGARCFAEKFRTRTFDDVRQDIFQDIAMKIAKIWFSDNTIKILALEIPDGTNPEVKADAIMGAENRIFNFISQFLKAFLTEEQEASINFKATFQAGYESINGVNGDDSLPQWARTLVSKAEFAGQTVPTDPSPEMITGGMARVAGFERGIYRRDGDGNSAPKADYFRKRLQEFSETMDSGEYVCKMVQIGPTRLMLVMHRSYTHYMVEELRLLPQFDVSPEEMANLKPDAISFLGLPEKVMGQDYRIGYFMDEYTDGVAIPVSWVDRENITDYVGYLKKPLLTMGNERVKSIGGLPIHGSALTIELHNGLRKTVVLAGDSGTGKSETIIAMVEQIIKAAGGAKNVKALELLSGDMLSLFTGEDGQIYMLGTESGDFMRLSDLSGDWQTRFRDRFAAASKTNRNHPTNPRATIPHLCDEHTFLRPVRVNMFFNINNFQEPPGTAFQEDESPANLLMDSYPRGYRREKGTSGDQPNIYASVLYSEHPHKSKLLQRYREEFDQLLGWDVILDETGKVKNGILSFRDIPGQIFKAHQMVKDLFEGSHCNYEDKNYTILKIHYRVRENRFYVQVKDEDTGAQEEKPLDRKIFDGVYDPIASTYCGNPFIHPEGMAPVLRRFAVAMKEAGVITGNLYTQLARPGLQFSGPAIASQAILKFIQEDPRVNARFQRHKRIVAEALVEKYGTEVFGQASIPQDLEAQNLLLLERQQSDSIHLVDGDRRTIPIHTPYYQNKQGENGSVFKPSLITTEVATAIKDICDNQDYALNLDGYNPDLSLYRHIRHWDTKEELIYQILIINGIMRLGYHASDLALQTHEVRKAEKIAEKIIAA